MPADSAPPSEVCVLALKAYDLAAAAPLVRASGPGTVCCLSNGMGLEREWGAGWEDVDRGVTACGFERIAPNAVRIHGGSFEVRRGGALASVLEGSGFEVREFGGIESRLWGKWLVNSSLNPVAAVSGARNRELAELGLDVTVGEIRRELSPAVPDAFREEAVLAADVTLERLLADSCNRCSMLADLGKGRTELDWLTGLGVSLLPRGSCPLAYAFTALVRAAASRA